MIYFVYVSQLIAIASYTTILAVCGRVSTAEPMPSWKVKFGLPKVLAFQLMGTVDISV